MDSKFAIGKTRLRKSQASHDNLDQITGSDRARVLFSSAFRRMQRKAQVFPLDLNASVRTRLVHSLEVGHIGRYIAETICDTCNDQRLSEVKRESGSFANIVETACFLHDIGNPPFGHLGELAIQEWFESNFIPNDVNEQRGASSISDFVKFDGNCQGTRLATKLQGPPGKRGLNLTTTQIASMVKYPRVVPKTELRETKTKYSVFDSERILFFEIWDSLGLTEGQRHPFSYLMECADDIAYCLSDIEDAIEKGILTRDNLETLKSEIQNKDISDKARDIVHGWDIDKDDLIWSLIMLRTSLINHLTERAAYLWCSELDVIQDSKLDSLFRKGGREDLLLGAIKDFARKDIFSSEQAINPELSGYRAIFSILDAFSPLLMLNSSEAKKLLSNPKGGKNSVNKRLALKLPEKYRKVYLLEAFDPDSELEEWQCRAHLICDYVCGMTDIYALQTCHTLSAVSPQSV